MGNIVLLDDLTINQIAAGEVIERPASVIKEMVENSIDAGATNITVEIKNGGISYIKITDNGKGIAQDDLEIAFERHATSKIRSAEDLDTVTSMGFRGEALASIAAIANVEMISKTSEQDIGYKVVVEAGEILEKVEAGCSTGTSITVRNLFFNTPVRYKFLKKDYTESGYIEDVITRVALVHPEISIKLINTGKTVIQTNGNGDLKSVIYSIYGKDVADAVLPVSYTYEDITVEGIIGKPEIARSNRAYQLFFVNKRFIKDKTLSAATEQAYKGMIPIGKFGFVVLNLTMNPAKVDVNVHPAKLEVRFEEESKVFQSIYHSIKDTLLKNDLVAGSPRTRAEDVMEISNKKVLENDSQNGVQSVKYDNANEDIETENKPSSNLREGSLFGTHKPTEEQIKTYTQMESQIKTNVGEPINTADVLEELKKLQANIQKEVEANPSIKLNNSYLQMNDEIKKKEEELINKQKVELEQVKPEVENIKQENQEQELPEQHNLQQENSENESVEQNTIGKEKNIYTPKTEGFEKIKDKIEELDNNTSSVSENFDEMYQKLFGTAPIKTSQEEKKQTGPFANVAEAVDLVKNNCSVFDEGEEYKVLPYKFIGIVFSTYIIIEMNKEMYIIDQHAAHERIMYEKVKKNYYSDSTKDSQMLLLPDVITLSHKEMLISKENMAMFEKAGFCLEEFGENTIKLTGVPTICLDLDTKDLFLETLDEINTVARTAKQEKEEKFIATVACKAAVKANMALTKEEVESLMDQLLDLPNPFTCPHGRPTAIKMTKYDIERKFARK